MLHRRRLALLEVAEGPSPSSPERPQALVAELFYPITANIQTGGFTLRRRVGVNARGA
ncbi:hypothetical protein ACFW2Y_34680 [Streptomyces sp. NPDC058877]|uniref:hypothetical protein n=1 Tax=unclassified Streptomyces TaxID=2593676 RepID=UPI00367E6450